MRRMLAVLVALSSAVLGAHAGPLPDTPLISSNVQVIGSIPFAGAVGGQIRTVDTLLGPKRYFIVTGVPGVAVFDVTVPEAPVMVSLLPLPHWENEDVDFGDDVLIVSQDPQWFFAGVYGEPEAVAGLYLIDISRLPALTFAYVNPATGNRWTEPVADYAGHTTTCIRTDCSYAYVHGVGQVTVVDLRTPSEPEVLGQFDSTVGSTHDAQMDETGIVWEVGSGGVVGYNTATPTAPKIVAGPFSGGLNYHHNSWRPRASAFVPRSAGDNDPTVRPGELLMVTEEEIYGQIACQGQGRFQTEWVRDTDAITGGARATIEKLDTWTTEGITGGEFQPIAPVCSAHYFDEADGIVAIAWYEQGLRFLDVSDPRDIRQVGYWIGPATVAWNVKWAGPAAAIGGEILYTMDGSRGIDVVRFERADAMPTVRAPVLEEWRWARPQGIPHPQWGYACRLPSMTA